MEEAMANHLILEAIAKVVPYKDLKTMRVVNKEWSIAIKHVFRERSVTKSWKSIRKVEELLAEEAGLLNQELLAKVHLKFLLGRELERFIDALQNIPEWFKRVHVMEVRGYNSKELNRFLSYLIYRMPNLEKIEWRILSLPFHGQDRIPAEVVIPVIPTNAEFSLTSVKMVFSVDTHPYETRLNPNFLWYCKKLKCFDAVVEGSPIAFIEFLNAWETMNRTREIRYNCIKLKLHKLDFIFDSALERLGGNPERLLCNAMVCFLNMHQPRSIYTGVGFLNLDFSRRWDQVSPEWTPALAAGLAGNRVRQLELVVPLESTQGLTFPNWSLQNLQRIPAFSLLNKLTLKIDDREDNWVNDEQRPSFAAHTLDSVTSLTIVIGNGIWGWEYIRKDSRFFSEKIAPFLPNVSSLYLESRTIPFFFRFGGDDMALAGVFQGLKEFHKMKEVTFDLGAEQVAPVCGEGSFAKLGVLEDLQRLNIKIDGYIGNHKRLMVSLFYGYEPHVELNLEYGTTTSYRVIKLSAQEFQAEMKVYDVRALNRVIKVCVQERAKWNRYKVSDPSESSEDEE